MDAETDLPKTTKLVTTYPGSVIPPHCATLPALCGFQREGVIAFLLREILFLIKLSKFKNTPLPPQFLLLHLNHTESWIILDHKDFKLQWLAFTLISFFPLHTASYSIKTVVQNLIYKQIGLRWNLCQLFILTWPWELDDQYFWTIVCSLFLAFPAVRSLCPHDSVPGLL